MTINQLIDRIALLIVRLKIMKMKDRNKEIYKRVLLGRHNRLDRIAKDYNLSRERIYQIVEEEEAKDLTVSKAYAKLQPRSSGGQKS